MRKIGIMTWYKFQNPGTALQAVALSKEIERNGFVPTFIQYTQKYEQPAFSFRFLLKKMAEQSNWRKEYQAEQKTELYKIFLKENIKETVPCESEPELEELNNEFDAFVCGSDQIWSPLCFDEKYFLPFVHDMERMIAYAPSIGVNEIENDRVCKRMGKLIDRFQYLSVREQQGADIIRRLCGKEPKVVLDPTFLLDREQWLRLTKDAEEKVKTMPQNYILCYFLGDYRRYRTAVKKISRTLKLPTYVIPCSIGQKRNCVCIPFEVGPKEFVQLIHKAAYVCTDSFHGMSFSIQFHKPFSVFRRFRKADVCNQNSRIDSLLDILKLKNRIVDEEIFSPDETLMECSFEKCDEILKIEKKQSEDFLVSALNRAAFAEKSVGKMERIDQTEWCCGCGVCACCCPTNAIQIIKNQNGFEQCCIEEEKCIHCGKCLSCCPFYQIHAKSISEVPYLYGYKSNSMEILRTSSSGGAGYDIAEMLSKSGYWVAGCTYIEKQDCAKHILIDPGRVEDIRKIQGSKYIQSSTDEVMRQISELPEESKLLFLGTPCQTSAADKMLRSLEKRETAVLVDLICHGVPTDILWKRYLKEKDIKYHVGVHPDIQFRSEKKPWRERYIYVHGKNGREYTRDEIHDDFYAFFRHGMCYMETCYECPFREKSAADIRIGDYWGGRFLKDKEGVSMVIPITESGNRVIEKLEGWKEVYPVSDYWSAQFPYNKPKPLAYESVMNDLKNDKIQLKEIRRRYVSQKEKMERAIRIKKKFQVICKKR